MTGEWNGRKRGGGDGKKVAKKDEKERGREIKSRNERK